MKAPKKSSRNYLQRRRNGETGTTRVLPKLQEIFNTVVNQCDRRTRETRSLRLFCFEQVSALKKISKKQYTSKIQTKRRTRQKVPFGTQKMPKLAQIPEHEQSSIMCMSSGDTFACGSCATPHFDVICDQLLNRRTATWNLQYLRRNEASREKTTR